jgi:hypothetical protein
VFDESKTTRVLEETRAIREEFVRPIYLSLLHANFARRSVAGPPPLGRPESELSAIRAQIVVAAKTISDEQLKKLLSIREWRGRLVAGWLVGLSKRAAFVDEIADILLASEMVYAGQGYCVALGLIGDDKCRNHLRAYLSKYLPLSGRFYDQQWAIGALVHIELNSPDEFLLPELWVDGDRHMIPPPSQAIQRFSELVDYLNLNQMRVVV